MHSALQSFDYWSRTWLQYLLFTEVIFPQTLDDWQLERTSNVFFLGDIINIEASVIQANHVPLRVFMDTCVATLAPSMDSVPRYAFIDNQGWVGWAFRAHTNKWLQGGD